MTILLCVWVGASVAVALALLRVAGRPVPQDVLPDATLSPLLNMPQAPKQEVFEQRERAKAELSSIA